MSSVRSLGSFGGDWACFIGLSVKDRSPLYIDSSFGIEGEESEDLHEWSGIIDEKAMYFQTTGLLMAKRSAEMPYKWSRKYSHRDQVNKFPVKVAVGAYGFYMGPEYHVIDPVALGDPLLSKLPSVYKHYWRVGHYTRDLPEGYIETLREGTGKLTDTNLQEYLNKIHIITRAPVFSLERFKVIMLMNLGMCDH